ncbi:hypothetical protein EB796_009061 [Bugula neritina]|uniref:Uncharacterized protein n=1 Tax=Bugula neritina TaxID=10212 RepID=A0A7J7K1W9_BUGNE|nr:hypothetical protein EB796_009061 [Bugula neritina]
MSVYYVYLHSSNYSYQSHSHSSTQICLALKLLSLSPPYICTLVHQGTCAFIRTFLLYKALCIMILCTVLYQSLL